MNSLVWFGNNLRVTDNSSLARASKGSRVIGVFCFDPRWQQQHPYGFAKMGRFRARFLLQSVLALRESLKALHITLLVYHARPEDILPRVVETHAIDTIYRQREWTRDEDSVLRKVQSQLAQGVRWEEEYDQFLYHPDDLPYQRLADIPNVFTDFRKRCERYARIRPYSGPISPLPKNNLLERASEVPSMEALGYREFKTDPRTAFHFQGGEAAAMDRIRGYFWQSNNLSRYKKTRNGLLGSEYSSKLSAWLANGCISARTVYAEVKKYEREVQKNQDTYWLIFELIWRDFFKYISLKYGGAIFKPGGIRDRHVSWKRSKSAFEKWTEGTTPEPFVNANMRELALTGWMSNRGRQNVASYWSREMGQDWRSGAAYFESLLIDYDVHSNWGNWMYHSGVGNDPRDRKFNIKRQAEHYDPNGEYQRYWLQQQLFQEPDLETRNKEKK